MQNMPLRIYSGDIAGFDAVRGIGLQIFLGYGDVDYREITYETLFKKSSNTGRMTHETILQIFFYASKKSNAV